jgi:hypothetical protein
MCASLAYFAAGNGQCGDFVRAELKVRPAIQKYGRCERRRQLANP